MKFTILALLPFLSLFALMAAARGGVAPYISTLVTSIESLKTQLHQPQVGQSYSAALRVNQAAQGLVRSLQSATTFLNQHGQLSSTEASQVLDNMKKSLPIVKDATTTVAALKTDFQHLGLVGIARSDVLKLQAATQAFTQSVVDNTPSRYEAQAKHRQQEYNAALASAAAAYSP
ncbi:hypothetical protein A4X13_0g5036 [Tilletia indica]|uniref:Uncharacterized protein n=1 Tax=Tilletia indica TaxID=43049 RepID=A0A177TU57_9BASI|nr:hypothetical protein A4X13_0g5036 [Tilletia indica]